jgi:hypothetical protein
MIEYLLSVPSWRECLYRLLLTAIGEFMNKGSWPAGFRSSLYVEKPPRQGDRVAKVFGSNARFKQSDFARPVAIPGIRKEDHELAGLIYGECDSSVSVSDRRLLMFLITSGEDFLFLYQSAKRNMPIIAEHVATTTKPIKAV